jgi:FkbM family methyltransferase
MQLIARVRKPAYIYRPDQLLRRSTTRRAPTAEMRVVLPWGLPIVVSGTDLLGRGIIRRNVHELAVTEVAWRLTDASDIAVDVGANSGYFTALLAFRARRVLAFEPHPALAVRLSATVAAWPAPYRDRVTVSASAVSHRAGAAPLSIPAGFDRNEGIASLDGARSKETIDVATVTLDEALGERRVGVLKLDVEGHELAALEGARRLLSSGAIRDVLFEEHHSLPSIVSRHLAEHGYAVFGLRERLRGVLLADPRTTQLQWDAPTYLATLDPDRATARIRLNGWNCLRPRPSA